MHLTREAILNGKGRIQITQVPVPEWGDNGACVYVRTLRADEGGEVQQLAASHSKGEVNEARAMVGWCIMGICNKQGKRLFSEQDVDALLAAPLMAIQRCATAIMELNGVTEEAATQRRKKSGRTGKTIRI